MTAVWAGIDTGKRTHHCVVINDAGRVLLSRRVVNDETALLQLIAAVHEVADGDDTVWATDLNSGGAALLIALLAERGQQVLYIPGRIVHHAAATYRGDGKTDAKDARIIADQARMRTDLQPVRGGDRISTDLRLLTARRTDLTFDRVRAINRLRATMLDYFPALEAAFDYSKKAPLILVAGYQTPDGIRRIGASRLTAWLKKRGARNATAFAAKAVEAAHAQHTVLATQATGSRLVARLAEQIMAIDADIAELDAEIEDRFGQHPDAPILLSMPGFGVVSAATFLANTGGDLNAFETVDRLASVAGLAPAPRDSGRISGNHHRPHRFNRRLMRTCYLAALSSLKNSPASRTFYDRKRAEGKSHKQAVIALARRRINTIWAMLRDRTLYHEPAPTRLAAAA
ncbi:IS110 family RNA-guided transposase [Haloechinothrix halophila]|uniref:Transposase n=1 Tax=Haloechinothrix halophila YIM 93223 TaxID=592678 RepID=W9DNA1_9PSEU|nr:IS110 family transposase [Haloechinothrix halophila]ETA66398.1 transposase [Haloechinothrix halophila YIM 93223]